MKTTKTKVATYLGPVEGFTGEARHYRLDPPIEDRDNETTHEYVVVSATYAMFTGPETYIFPADKKAKVTDWGELEGSFRGGIDHNKALDNAGYRVAE
jgi:hypothetical protein